MPFLWLTRCRFTMSCCGSVSCLAAHEEDAPLNCAHYLIWLVVNDTEVTDFVVTVSGSTGKVYTLPTYRIAGIFAPANGAFSTAEFTVPAEPMWINADVSWHGGLNTSYDGKAGCDEGCAAYLFVAVLDAATGQPLAGYSVDETIPMMGVDGLQMRLLWKASKDSTSTADGAAGGTVDAQGSESVVDTAALVGKRVRLRLYFRDATVYAVGAG
jgi:hypothetical protein